MSAYALLASVVLTALRRMRLADRGEQVRAVSGEDLHQIERLREVLMASWSGAELAGLMGEAPPEPRQLRADAFGGSPSLNEKLQTYELVRKVLPAQITFDAFVPRAEAVLGSLHDRGEWRALELDDREFAESTLEPFLERLTRGGELVMGPGRQSVSPFSTLV
jgi:hypothetical protein